MAIGKGDIRTRITMTPHASVVNRAFAEAGVEVGDFRQAWPRVAGHMRSGIVRAIQTRGGSIGHPWPTSTPAYLRRKGRAGLGGRQMVRKGRVLAQAMSAKPVRMTKKSVSVGFPPGKRWQHVPKLQFKDGYWIVDMDERTKQLATEELNAYIQEIFARVRQKLGAA